MRRILVALTLVLSISAGACQPAATAAPPPERRAATAAEVAAADAQWRATVEFAAAVQRWQDEQWRRTVEFAAAVEAARLAELAYPSGQCGGSLPPCSVLRNESRGDIRIWNGGCYAPFDYAGRYSPCGISSASGKWQFTRGTWAWFGGFRNAADAPERVQDEKARQLWAGGRGCGHWSACGRRVAVRAQSVRPSVVTKVRPHAPWRPQAGAFHAHAKR